MDAALMKIPTRYRKERNRRRVQDRNRRRLKHKRWLKGKRRAESWGGTGRFYIADTRYTVEIKCPKNMSLEENFDRVTKLLSEIRAHGARHRQERVYINFKEIEQISPGAALVLAAELDRWTTVPHRLGTRLRAVDIAEWANHVRHRLEGMGFFDLLEVTETEGSDSGGSNTVYVRFRTGQKVDGKAVEDLRTLDLEPFIEDNVPNRRRLFAAVTEAMTNVVHHAYVSESWAAPRKWWLSASHNVQAREIRILLYDQGSGIPQTLPRRFGERIRSMLPGNLRLRDSALIEAAHALERTATDQEHRGHGLQRDVRRYAEAVDCTSAYRVTSLRGQYSWMKGPNGQPQESSRDFNNPLPGTLIEWRLTLQ